MDCKTFKQDLTYCCKKFTKEGKILSAFGDNLDIVDGQFVSKSEHMDPLEMFALIKGYTPTQFMIQNPGYNLSLLDVISEQAGLTKADLYLFLDGFENVISVSKYAEKIDFYQLGVYIREKFSPVGARTEPLRSIESYVFSVQEKSPRETMFSVYTRRGETIIVEAECYRITAFHDPSVNWLKPFEFKCLVTAPEMLFEKKSNGTLGPAIYFSHSLFPNYNDALKHASDLIEKEFAFKKRKYGKEYDGYEVAAAIMTIKLEKLPGSTFKTDAEIAKENLTT